MDCADAAVGLLLGTLRRPKLDRSQLVCKFQPSMGSVSFPTALAE
jgi:hypothetical protein